MVFKLFVLTDKGMTATKRVSERYKSIEPVYGPNTFDRLVFELQDVPACVIFFAVGKSSGHDADEMVRRGYAKWLRIPDTQN